MSSTLIGCSMHHIRIGDIDCLVEFENIAFSQDYDRYLVDFRNWGFSNPQQNQSAQIHLTIRNGRGVESTGQETDVFSNSHVYDGINVFTQINTESFEGEMFLDVTKEYEYTPARIIDLVDISVCTAYMFYFFKKKAGVLVHSCGIVDTDVAYIFAGHSGAGKSTVAQLSAPRMILSDEIVLLQSDSEGNKKVCGTPFVSKAQAANIGMTCGGIFFLEQSPSNALIPISRLDAAIRLLQEGVLGNYIAIPEVRNIISQNAYLDLLAELIKSIPCYVLQFKKDNSFWEVINEQRT